MEYTPAETRGPACAAWYVLRAHSLLHPSFWTRGPKQRCGMRRAPPAPCTLEPRTWTQSPKQRRGISRTPSSSSYDFAPTPGSILCVPFRRKPGARREAKPTLAATIVARTHTNPPWRPGPCIHARPLTGGNQRTRGATGRVTGRVGAAGFPCGVHGLGTGGGFDHEPVLA